MRDAWKNYEIKERCREMNCLFKVRRKSTGEIVPVYGIKSEHFVEFLIYSRNMDDGSCGRWLYVLADRFEPIEKGGVE